MAVRELSNFHDLSILLSLPIYHYLLKAHDYAAGAAGHLSQNSLKRSYGAVTKSRRRNPNTSHIAPPLHLNQMIEGINKMFPDMKLSINR